MLEWRWIPPSRGRHRKEIVGMRESLGSEGIWTHGLGGGRRRDVEDAGLDREWRPDVTSGRRRVHSNG